MSSAAFSESFKQKLNYGKYTYWAVDLNEDQLEALLWGIGEYTGRLREAPTISDDQTEIIVTCRNIVAGTRMKVGLDTIARVSNRDTITVDDVRESIVQSLARLLGEDQ